MTEIRIRIRRAASLAAAIVGLTALLLGGCAPRPEQPFTMRFIGHDSFAFNAGDGTVVVCDPYGPGSTMSGVPDFPAGYEAAAVTVSHSHPDHNFIRGVGGEPRAIRVPGVYRFGDMKLSVYAGKEGKPAGLSNNSNLICVFERDGCKVVHLGDSGIIVDEGTLAAIGGADVVIVNIDNYVIPQGKIMGFMAKIGARTVVPAHWEGEDQLERFLAEQGAGSAVARSGSDVALSAGMPAQVLVMKPFVAKD